MQYGSPLDPANITDRDLDEAARQGERMLAWLENADQELVDVVGKGEAPSGQVRATVDHRGLVLGVAYGPRAMRLGSRELAEETLEAVRAATEDAGAQVNALISAALPGFDPVSAAAELQGLLRQDP